MLLLLLSLLGCAESFVQNVGVGAVITQRCSSDMEARAGEYRAICTPAACPPQLVDVGVSHVVVAVIPNERVLGYAERSCLQSWEPLAAPAAATTPTPKADETTL
jgi:hypothetical protein